MTAAVADEALRRGSDVVSRAALRRDSKKKAEREAPPAVERTRLLFQTALSDPASVREALAALSEDELTTFWFGPSMLLNAMSLFGEIRSPEQVRSTAAEANRNVLWRGWETRHLSASIAQGVDVEVELPGFPIAEVRRLTESGRGVVLAPLQFGDARYTQFIGAQNRMHASIALTSDVYAQYEAMRTFRPEAPLWEYTHPVDVESEGGALKLLRTLMRGGIIQAFADGNAGVDGYFGDATRTAFNFLGYDVRVKHGFAELAAVAGCSILPFLPSGGRMTECRVWPVIDPGSRLRGAEAKQFAAEAVKRIYGLYEPTIYEYPEEWGQLHLFHRWRAPEAPSSPSPPGEARRALESELSRGSRFRMNRRRIVPTSGDEGTRWLDVRTLKSIRVARNLDPLAARLANPVDGVDIGWIDGQPDSMREISLELMSALRERDAIEAYGT